jgi:heat shock protein HtpX
MSNSIKSVLLLAALTGLLVVMGRVIGGNAGMIFAFGLAVVMNFGSYWFSDQIALRMAGAREVSPEEAPELHSIVDELAYRAGLPKPRVAIVDSMSPNAFATGRDADHAVVAATTGILRILNRDELMAVLGHELGHVRNHDILLTSVASAIGSAITWIAYTLLWFGGDNDSPLGAIGAIALVLLAPLAAGIIQMAISRQREFSADATGAEICGNPESLASALLRLEAGSQAIPMQVNQAAEPLYIVKPFSGGGFASLFSTHPPIDERVRRLRQMRPTIG